MGEINNNRETADGTKPALGEVYVFEFIDGKMKQISIGLESIERATMLKLPMHPSLVLCGVTARFLFSQDSEIETVTIKADGVAEASVYWYIDDSSTVYLANLLVNPNYRNKGIGKQLQEIREQIGKDLNAKTSCLWVKKESWMFKWYQRRGYSELKTHSRKGFVWMTKPLF